MSTLTPHDAARHARAVLEWRRSRTRRQPFIGLAAGDIDAAYDVQEAAS